MLIKSVFRSVYLSLFLIFWGFFSQKLSAGYDAVIQSIPDAQIVGEARLSVLFWDVYDAQLYAPSGRWSEQNPFVLRIRYLRKFSGKAIAERSVEEMRKQGFTDEPLLAAWYAQMQSIFPDVKKGDVLSAVFLPDQHTEFFLGNQSIGLIKGDAFIEWFSGIWLSEKTSEPQLRKALLGNT